MILIHNLIYIKWFILSKVIKNFINLPIYQVSKIKNLKYAILLKIIEVIHVIMSIIKSIDQKIII